MQLKVTTNTILDCSRIGHILDDFRCIHTIPYKIKNPDNHTISRVLILPEWQFVGMTGLIISSQRVNYQIFTDSFLND
ncbi:hypothetical protein HME9304_00257 [Flagellimonas maritima]|uniref:Uncharacterized protein n=1 Tax=Flagellimonas maritima TaxID=1383885 RepID=A0A2Z4LND6_9FLAO|nr:hypothetical protein HME9304_00257 [Allomuricauda aurantiaca]